jgi:hypothetical protein
MFGGIVMAMILIYGPELYRVWKMNRPEQFVSRWHGKERREIEQRAGR